MKRSINSSDIFADACIAMGSNLDHPEQQLIQGVKHLRQLPQSQLTGCSKLYRSLPVGPQNQPAFYNAVVALKTALSPLQLLKQLQMIEQLHNRKRDIHWGPRTLDLDILLYDHLIIKTKQLTVPHYQMHLRNFVLFPLADINKTITLPGGQSVSSLCRQIGNERLWIEKNSFFEQLNSQLKKLSPAMKLKSNMQNTDTLTTGE